MERGKSGMQGKLIRVREILIVDPDVSKWSVDNLPSSLPLFHALEYFI